MSDNGERLDRLLSAPLPHMDDAGFSARVVARIVASQERRWRFDDAAVLALLGLPVAFAASTRLTDWAGHFGFALATSVPLATAGLALALSMVYARATAD